jgi:exodeoxyribonuclease V alpha subunit
MAKTDPQERTFDVSVDQVYFHEPKTNYAIVSCSITHHANPDHIGNKLVCKGNLHPVHVGAIYHVKGIPVFDKKFNKWGVKVSDWKETTSLTEKGLINYLIREGPNVGDKRAAEIAETIGSNAIDKIADDYKCLLSIKGVTEDRAKELSEWAKGEKRNMTTKTMLYGLGLGPALVAKILGFFGQAAHARLDKECFRLTSVDGIGFKTAAMIADALGIPSIRPDRVQAGVFYMLQEMMKEGGHTRVPQDKLVTEACKLLGVTRQKVVEQMKVMLTNGMVCTNRSDPAKFSSTPEIFDKEVSSGKV